VREWKIDFIVGPRAVTHGWKLVKRGLWTGRLISDKYSPQGEELPFHFELGGFSDDYFCPGKGCANGVSKYCQLRFMGTAVFKDINRCIHSV
jgi:hypothetical protein